MPSNLRNRLNELAKSFSVGVLDAIRGASLQEVLAESGGRATALAPARGAVASATPARRRPGRLPRRSAGDISKAVEAIVTLLASHPKGLRAEEIRQKLGVQAKELPRPLKEGVDAGQLSKVGRKRATTYFVGAATGEGRKSGRAGRRNGGNGSNRRKGKPAKAGPKVAKKRSKAGVAAKPSKRAKRANRARRPSRGAKAKG